MPHHGVGANLNVLREEFAVLRRLRGLIQLLVGSRGDREVGVGRVVRLDVADLRGDVEVAHAAHVLRVVERAVHLLRRQGG